MIRIRDLSLRPSQKEDALLPLAAGVLGVKPRDIRTLSIHRRSIDARKKKDVRVVYTVDADLGSREETILRRCTNPKVSLALDPVYQLPVPAAIPSSRPVVVGFGPAGMFAALILAQAGLRPLVLERGLDAASRKAKVDAFWQTGILDPQCNVQFGEGGAGTFSDGKLNTGIKNPRCRYVLEQLVQAGASPDILIDAKPHIGTDVLVEVVQNLRHTVEALGGEVRFSSQVMGLEIQDGTLRGLWVRQSEKAETLLPCSQVVLAIGHSARDTFLQLHKQQVPMEPKPFSMGVRIEHRQEQINQSQYGAFASCPDLPPAEYKLNVALPDGTSAYTFCMCPGGHVVAAASEPGRICTNGMSYAARDGENANAAVLVTLHPQDFPDSSPLGGMFWQQAIEEAAFQAGGGSYRAPCQLVGDFLAGKPSTALGSVQPTYRPGVTLCDLHQVLPKRLTQVLEAALPALDRRLSGFASQDALLTAPETRSSSPVRILRSETKESPIRGLYPCGEGAGYAGGIVSAAVDGMLCAEAIIIQS